MADWRPSPVKAAKYKIVRCLVGRHQDGARGDHCACTMADPKPLRVLSLLSASTEIVYRLGCGHLLVGRSHGCDDPPLATTLPVATAPQIDPNAPSAQIDEAVRAQSVAGGPVYHIHADLVKRLRPDVVITQEQCRICAVTPEDVSAWECGRYISPTPPLYLPTSPLCLTYISPASPR